MFSWYRNATKQLNILYTIFETDHRYTKIIIGKVMNSKKYIIWFINLMF